MAPDEKTVSDHQGGAPGAGSDGPGASRGDDPPQTEAMDPSRVLIHDFRNLLAVIVNYSELIGQELDDPEAIRADVLEIKAAAERAIAMTEQLPRLGRPPQ